MQPSHLHRAGRCFLALPEMAVCRPNIGRKWPNGFLGKLIKTWATFAWFAASKGLGHRAISVLREPVAGVAVSII
jgi:hypothetical protein